MAEVDHVVGNHDKLDAGLWRELALGPRVVVRDVMTVRDTAGIWSTASMAARGFVQVQNGCDHRCTFCIIPYGRGPSRSVPAGEVVSGPPPGRRGLSRSGADRRRPDLLRQGSARPA